MNTFYAFDTKVGSVERLAFINDKLVTMTEGDSIAVVDRWNDYLYLGEKNGFLRALTIMNLFCYIRTNAFWAFEYDVDELVSRLKQFGLRCDPDNDICEMKAKMNEVGRDDWNMEIIDANGHNIFLSVENCCEAFCTQLARKVIEAAIALGVDIRTTWEFHRLEEIEQNDHTNDGEEG